MASYINNIPTKNIDPKIRENNILREQNEQYRHQIKKMAEHIEKLTKLVESSICVKCSSSKSSKKVIIEEEESSVEPSGIKILPHLKTRQKSISQIEELN